MRVETGMRWQVVMFALRMEEKLQRNDHKEHWTSYSAKWLLNRLRQETQELTRAIENGEEPEAIANEAADVANFAMMVADVCGGLTAEAGASPFKEVE